MRPKRISGLAAILIVGSLALAGKLRAQEQASPPQPVPNSTATTGGSQQPAGATRQAGDSGAGSSSASAGSGPQNLLSVDFYRNRAAIPYFAPQVPDISMTNSERLHSLIQGGKLELSLDDAIALALENNLDIAVARYPLIYAKIDILRTAAGGSFRGINPGLLGVVSAFSGGGGGGSAGGSGGGAGLTGSSGVGSVGSASCCDPFMGASFRWDRNTSPVNFTNITGGLSSVTNQLSSASLYYAQGFLTGTSFAVGLGGTRVATSAVTSSTLFNPEVPTGLTMGFSQNLLNGFGYRANAKFIRIAKNDLKLADSTFKQQVITTVVNVANLYSDLVSFKENVRVAQQALTYAEKLLADNKRQVEIGTLAPIEVVRAESEVASDEQALIVAQTSYQQQQELLKTAISKHVDADLTAATVEPTDKFPEPKPDDIPPLETALHQAEANRPELVQTDISIRNQEITVQASRNGLLPFLNVWGTYAPTGLSGNQIVNGQVVPGGLWQSLGQSFRANYPDYEFGMTLQVPLRNRQAQADMTVALLQQRQLRVQLQQQKNTVAQDVRNAEIAVTQARAQVAAAIKATRLQQETLDAEQKKFQLGESTVFLVIQTQRDLATAEGNEVKARSAYAKALTQFAQSTATILDRYNIELADAKTGRYHAVPNIPGTSELPAPTSFTPTRH